MAETTIFEEYVALTGIKRKSGEKYLAYVKRLTKALGEKDIVSDDDFSTLSQEAQHLAEQLCMAVDDKQPPPMIPGYPQPAEAAIPESDSDPAQEAAAESEAEAVEAAEAAEATAQETAAPAKKKAKTTVKSSNVVKLKQKEASAKAGKPKAKKTAASANGRGRPGRFAPDDKIKILVEGCPKKGTKAKAYWKKYKDGMTYEQAIKAGIPNGDVQYNHNKKFIKVGGSTRA